jgi:transposase
MVGSKRFHKPGRRRKNSWLAFRRTRPRRWRAQRPTTIIDLSAAERAELEGLAKRRKTAQGLARRARIILAAVDGLEKQTIAQRLGASENTVGKWRRRFVSHWVDGLCDEPRPGAPRRIGDEEVAETVRLTLETTPPGSTHWSLRSTARAVGYAPSTIHRIWKAFGLQPHRTETFKLSADPLFVEKVRDIVGLYLAPPDRALAPDSPLLRRRSCANLNPRL